MMTEQEFKERVNKAMDSGLSIGEVARYFTQSISTIARWMSGDLVPDKQLREPVCKDLEALVEEKSIEDVTCH